MESGRINIIINHLKGYKCMGKILLSFILIVSPFVVVSQKAADVFSASEIVWLGLDFSHIKLRGQFTQVGSAGFKDEKEIQDIYFEAWNNKVVYEPEKFNLPKIFNVSQVPADIEMINKANAKANIKDMFTGSGTANILNETEVKKIVSGYNFQRKSGIGCVFVMEAFDKIAEEGSMWVTFIDIESGHVLFTERMVEKAGGFGLKNYWIRTVYNAMVKIQKSNYRSWKNKYAKK